ncbi:hypothetical protein [Herbidospora mongoliensis]|uniref:hypothetical protein n=1 Tax=Herbidospora mongoliensis TaxID=688067 RepID=UPI000A7881DF|nr:hypothetical protein [Herbidospora mongoliensis]
MTLPKIPLDDPRVLALARARQQFAHDCSFLPTGVPLTNVPPAAKPVLIRDNPRCRSASSSAGFP